MFLRVIEPLESDRKKRVRNIEERGREGREGRDGRDKRRLRVVFGAECKSMIVMVRAVLRGCCVGAAWVLRGCCVGVAWVLRSAAYCCVMLRVVAWRLCCWYERCETRMFMMGKYLQK